MSNDNNVRSAGSKRRKGKKPDGGPKPSCPAQARPVAEVAAEKPCNPFGLLDRVDEQGSVKAPVTTEWRSGRSAPVPVAAGKRSGADGPKAGLKGSSPAGATTDTVSVHITVYQNQHRTVDDSFSHFKPLRRVDVDQKISTCIVSRLVKAGVGNPTLLLITCRIPSTPHPKLVVLHPSDTLRKYLPGSRLPQGLHVDVFKVEAADRNKSTLDKFADVTFAFLKKVSELCGLPVWAVKRHLEANFDQSIQSHSLLQHQCEEHDQWATWNTGLIDSNGHPLFVFFFRNDRTRNKPWSLKGGNTPVYTDNQVRQWLKIKPSVRLPTSALTVTCLQSLSDETASDISTCDEPVKVDLCSIGGTPKAGDGGSLCESFPSAVYDAMSQDSSPRHSDVHSTHTDDVLEKPDFLMDDSCRSNAEPMEHDLCCGASITSEESDRSSCASHNLMLHDADSTPVRSDEETSTSNQDASALCEATLRKLMKCTEGTSHVTALHDCLGTWQEAANLLQHLYTLRQNSSGALPATCAHIPSRKSLELVDEGEVLQWMPQDLLAGA